MKCIPDTFAVSNLKRQKMKAKVILAGLLACIGISAQAKNVTIEEPKGKAIVQVFGNFHTGFGSENDNRGFELDRSYLGYEYNFGNGLSAKAVMDIGKSSDVSDYGCQQPSDWFWRPCDGRRRAEIPELTGDRSL